MMDEADATFNLRKPRISPSRVPVVSGTVTDKIYSMNYKNRGKCLIFNQKHFQFAPALTRKDTDFDANRLYCKFKELGFEVSLFTDLKVDGIEEQIKKASTANHEQNSCFVCCILSHGDEGSIGAFDGKYPLDNVFKPFRGDTCPTLAGKPKIFFIQACRGDESDYGVDVLCNHSADSPVEKMYSVKIPICADFLIAYATVPGFVSYRSGFNGSYFIQALCDSIDENIKELDLLSILTIVNNRVAFNYKIIPSDYTKQVPSINSTLTKMIKFF